MLRFVRMFAMAAVLLVLVSCGGPIPADPTPEPTPGTEVRLEPDDGATVELNDGATVVEFPPGAVVETADVVVTALAPNEVGVPPADFGVELVVSGVKVVGIDGSWVPVTVSFEVPDGLEHPQVVHEHGGAWSVMPSYLDEAGRLTVSTRTFSTFALVSSEPKSTTYLYEAVGFDVDKYAVHVPNNGTPFKNAGVFPPDDDFEGFCYGMAETAALYYVAGVPSPAGRGSQDAGGGDLDVLDSATFAAFIKGRQESQLMNQILQLMFKSKVAAIDQIAQAEDIYIKMSRGTPVIFAFSDLNLIDGFHHAVLVYRAFKRYDEAADHLQYEFWVYDPNGYRLDGEHKHLANPRTFSGRNQAKITVDVPSYEAGRWRLIFRDVNVTYDIGSINGSTVVPKVFTGYYINPFHLGLPWTNPVGSDFEVGVSGATVSASVLASHPSPAATVSTARWHIRQISGGSHRETVDVPVSGGSASHSFVGVPIGSYLVQVMLQDGQGNWSENLMRAGIKVEDGGAGFKPAPSYISISNVNLRAASGGARRVDFDISWPESWRGPSRPSWVASSDNWDAAWVFVKYRVSGGPWQHATLAASGHVQPPGSVVSVPGDRRGAFVYRGSGGYGTFAANGVGLQWDFVADGVAAGASVDVQPFGIEMVYVPQASFSVGSGGSRTGEFRAGGTTNTPLVVNSQSPITLGNGPGQLMWTTGDQTGSPSGSTSASFPTGYAAFYVMKYQVTQGQYVDFLNTLTQTQANERKTTDSSYRYAITGSSVGAYETSLPFVAMNYLSWADGAALADWAGLRPMTELEFEKAARGPLGPVANEFAWGSKSITQATGLANAGTITETPTPSGANANYLLNPPSESPIGGPVRVGSFVADGRSRRDAGAGYYGALELSGNLTERPVTVGNAEGRAFAGSHGDGVLDASGSSNEASWPGSSAAGAGFRGGSWYHYAAGLEVSARFDASRSVVQRLIFGGWRGVRSAP